MSPIETKYEVVYPESDGEPMGETDLHRNWMFRLYDLLHFRYRDQHVYVGSDLLLYFEQGNPRKFVVPDVFVVLDSDPGFRRTFRVWDEKRVPNIVIEVTSKSTRSNDESFKPRDYARIGVRELFLYDPTGDYLQPRLQGHRLSENGTEYVRIEPDASGVIDCEELDVRLSLDGPDLVLRDRSTGQLLLPAAETYQVDARQSRELVEAEQDARASEQFAREEAEASLKVERAKREAAEAELARLQVELNRLRKSDG